MGILIAFVFWVALNLINKDEEQRESKVRARCSKTILKSYLSRRRDWQKMGGTRSHRGCLSNRFYKSRQFRQFRAQPLTLQRNLVWSARKIRHYSSGVAAGLFFANEMGMFEGLTHRILGRFLLNRRNTYSLSVQSSLFDNFILCNME